MHRLCLKARSLVNNVLIKSRSIASRIYYNKQISLLLISSRRTKKKVSLMISWTSDSTISTCTVLRKYLDGLSVPSKNNITIVI